jgi:predicted ATPase
VTTEPAFTPSLAVVRSRCEAAGAVSVVHRPERTVTLLANTLQIDPSQRSARWRGAELPLNGRAFDLLVALVERQDRLSSRSELMHCVWGDHPVDDANLTVQIACLRRVLGPQCIVTVPGRGYHFILPGAPAAAALPASAPSTIAGSGHSGGMGLPLIGRDQDLAALRAGLQASRLVTLHGPGGIGKTTLALAVVDRLRAVGTQVGWASIESVDDAAKLAAVVGRSLQLELPGPDPLSALLKALRGQPQVVVLDGVERWAEAVADLTDSMLKAAPALRLLVTSQLPLHLPFERQQRLHPLEVPGAGASLEQARRSPAVQLFAHRAQASDHRFVLNDDNVADIGAICRHVEGLPLAIEMAAARVLTLGTAKMASELGGRLADMRASRRDLPDRQRSLRTAVTWTWQLLSERAQRVFRRLSVCVDDFSLGLAQAVAGDDPDLREPWDVVDVLAELVDASLLAVDARDPPRYRMLSTTRAVAKEQLQDFTEEHQARQRHARAMACIYAHIRDLEHCRPIVPRVEIDRQFSVEASNGLDAFEWAVDKDPNTAVALSIGLLRTIEIDYATKRSICRRSRALLGPGIDPLLIMKRAQQIGVLEREMIAEEPHVRFALEVARRCGDDHELYRSLSAFSNLRIAAIAEEQKQVITELVRLETAHPEWHPATRAETARRLCRFFPLDERLPMLQRAAMLNREGGNPRGDLFVTLTTIVMLILCGRYGEAIALARELEARLDLAANDRLLCYCQLNLLIALTRTRQLNEANEVVQRGWGLACAWDLQAVWTLYLALLAWARDDMPLAAVLLACSDARYGDDLERQHESEVTAREIRLATVAALEPSALSAAQARGAGLTDEDVAILFRVPRSREGMGVG